ncbi:MAG: hypothetical protein II971_03030 [Firmicutes bacterium]|nr:hypothetical protein [Bacillota bacterium]
MIKMIPGNAEKAEGSKRSKLQFVIAIAFILALICLPSYIKKTAPPDEAERVIAVSRLYKAAADHYCYFEEDGCDWDRAYEEALSAVLQVKDYRDYLRVLEEFRAHLKDHHCDGQIFLSGTQKLDDVSITPFLCSWYSGEYVVIRSADSRIHVGDVLTEINGVDAKYWLESELGSLIATETPDTRENLLSQKFCMYYPKGTKFTCSFKNTEGNTVSYKVKTGSYKWHESADLTSGMNEQILYDGDLFTVKSLPDDIYLVRSASFSGESVLDEYIHNIYPLIRSAKGIILDLRYNEGGNSAIGCAVLKSLSGITPPEDSLETQYSFRVGGPESIYSALLKGPMQGLYRDAFQTMFTDAEIALMEETGDKINSGALRVNEAQYSQIMNLLEEDHMQIDPSALYEIPLLSVPTVVLIDSKVGSAIDTVAQAANDMGIMTVGTHTAGATGDLFMVDLGGDIYTGFSSFYIFNKAEGVPLHNNGIKAVVQSDNDAGSVAEGIDKPLLDAWNLLHNDDKEYGGIYD